MVLIGIALLAAAAAFGIDVVAQNRYSIDVDGFGQTVSTSPAAVLVAGVVVGLAAAIGLMLLRDGLTRSRSRRIERRELEAERDRKIAMYEEEHGHFAPDGVATHNGETVDLRDEERVTTS